MSYLFINRFTILKREEKTFNNNHDKDVLIDSGIHTCQLSRESFHGKPSHDYEFLNDEKGF